MKHPFGQPIDCNVIELEHVEKLTQKIIEMKEITLGKLLFILLNLKP